MHSAFLLLTQGLAVGLLTLTRVSASGKDLLNYYSFEKYVQDYGKVYDSQHERANRKEIFQENLFTILQHNQENELKTGGYRMGINEWTDRRIPEEIPFGLKKNVPEEIYGLLKSKVRKILQENKLVGFIAFPDGLLTWPNCLYV